MQTDRTSLPDRVPGFSVGSCLWIVREVVASGWSSPFVQDSSGAIEGYRRQITMFIPT
jgi:hypothetical protein